MNINENDIYAPDTLPEPSTGGLVRGGEFGEPIAPYGAATPLLAYASQVNPNLLILGSFVIGGIFAVNVLVSSLGNANPNNTMLETRKIEAETRREEVKAASESMQALANQRPGCSALLCIVTGGQTPAAQAEVEIQPEPPADQLQPYSDPNMPDYYEQPPNPINAVPTDTATVEYWLYHGANQEYINDWIHHCRSEGGTGAGWQSRECRALSSALNQ